MKLSDIDTTNFKIVKDHRNKGIHSRVLYFDPETEKFIKIWGRDFMYKKYFEHVCNTYMEFFSDISLLEEVIKDDKGTILGYVMPRGISVGLKSVDDGKLNDLVVRLTNKCKKFNIVYLDLTIANIIQKDGVYYIVDLEETVSVNHLKEIPRLAQKMSFNNYNYVKSIAELLPFGVSDKNKYKW